MTTLVTGATGNTGRHVVTELVRRGEPVRALSRDPASAAALFAPEVEVVGGTHTDPGTLGAALDGIDRLHITVTAGLAESGPELVRRAVDAGVRRITVVWGGGFGPVEQAVAQSGVEWTRLEPQEFMSNTSTWIDSVRTEGVVREPYDFPSALVHEADIAAVAAVALLDDGHAGRAYNLTGPEALTPRQRIAILAEAIGRDIAFVPITHEQAVQQTDRHRRVQGRRRVRHRLVRRGRRGFGHGRRHCRTGDRPPGTHLRAMGGRTRRPVPEPAIGAGLTVEGTSRHPDAHRAEGARSARWAYRHGSGRARRDRGGVEGFCPVGENAWRPVLPPSRRAESGHRSRRLDGNRSSGGHSEPPPPSNHGLKVHSRFG
ncbi:SDR family oxidoreductase [Nocardia asteroides]